MELDFAGFLVGFLSFGATVFGGAIALGKLFQRSRNNSDAIVGLRADFKAEISEVKEHADQLQERLERTEDAARNFDKLANAVEHMGKRFEESLQNLAQVMGIHNANNNRRFDDVTEDIRALRERRTFTKE